MLQRLRRPHRARTVVAATTCAFAQDAKKCRLQKSSSGRFGSIGRHMAVDGAINGKKIGIVLDTGASVSIALSRVGQATRPRSPEESRGERVYGVGGETQVYTTVVDEFKLGSVAVRDLQLRVAGENDRGEGFDLLFGEDFLSSFDVEFDLANGVVRLWQPKDCDGARSRIGRGCRRRESRSKRSPTCGPRLRSPFTSTASRSTPCSTPAHPRRSCPSTTRGGRRPDPPVPPIALGVGAKTVESWIGKLRSFTIGNEDIPMSRFAFATSTRQRLTGDRQQDLEERVRGAAHAARRRLPAGASDARVAHSQRKMYFTYVGGPVFVTGRTKPPAQPPSGEKPKGD
jgi:predicted aspartyl protease